MATRNNPIMRLGLMAPPFLLLALSLLSSALASQDLKIVVPLGPLNGVTALQVLPNGELLSASEAAHIWDVGAGKLVTKIPLPVGGRGYFEPASPDGFTVVRRAQKGGRNYGINIYSGVLTECTHPMPTVDYQQLYTPPAAPTSDSPQEISAPRSNIVRTVGSFTSEASSKYPPFSLDGWCVHNDSLSLPFAADSFFRAQQTYYQLRNDTLRQWSHPTWQALEPLHLPGVVEATPHPLHFYAKGRFIAQRQSEAGSEISQYRIWDLNGKSAIADFSFPDHGEVTDIHPNGQYLLLRQRPNPKNPAFTTRSRFNIEADSIDMIFDGEITLGAEKINTLNCSLAGGVYAEGGTVMVMPGIDEIFVKDAITGKLLKTLRGRTRAYRVAETETLQNLPGITLLETIPRDLEIKNQSQIAYGKNRTINLTQGQNSDLSRLGVVRISAANENHLQDSVIRLKAPEAKALINSPLRYSLMADTHIIELNHRSNEIKILSNQGKLREQNDITESQYLELFKGIGYEGILLGDTAVIKDDIRFPNWNTAEYYRVHSLGRHQDIINSIALLKGNQRFVTCSNDGVIKVWDIEAKSLLATIMILDNKDWVVLGPNNLYDASPGAMSSIYFTVPIENRRSEIIRLDQLKAKCYLPDLLAKLLAEPEDRERLPPGLTEVALYPGLSSSISKDSLFIKLSPREGGIGKVSFFINGKLFEEDVNPARKETIAISLAPYGRFLRDTNTLGVRVYNTAATLRSELKKLRYLNKPDVLARGSSTAKPEAPKLSRDEYRQASLHIICVGTSHYGKDEDKVASMDLKFPDDDAMIMAQSLKAVGEQLFKEMGNVYTQCLTTNKGMKRELDDAGINWSYASKENIKQAFVELGEVSKPQDVVVVYFSGHGKAFTQGQDKIFYYLTQAASKINLLDEATLSYTGISTLEMVEWLKVPAAKQVMIIDACNSGAAVSNYSGLLARNLDRSRLLALDRMSENAGVYLLTGSAGDKESFEASVFGHGLLTYSLLRGMDGSAVRVDEAAGNLVDVVDLFRYADEQVPVLAKSLNQQQHPRQMYPTDVGSVVIGMNNGEKRLPLKSQKPMLVRSIFLNKATIQDDEELTQRVNTQLLEASMDTEAYYHFADKQQLPDAYRVSGLYTTNEDGTLNVNVVLECPQRPVVELTLKEARLKSIPFKINRWLQKNL